MEPGSFYPATQTTNYNDGAIFWMDYSGIIHSDLGDNIVLGYINDEKNSDIIILRVLLPWYEADTLRFIARNSHIKYNEVPSPGDSLHPFRGLGIINALNLFFVYNQDTQLITIFNIFNGSTYSLQAIYNAEYQRVFIGNNIQLKPNLVVPYPLQSNVHRWNDPALGMYENEVNAYRLFWPLGSSAKNPGKYVKGIFPNGRTASE